MYIKSVWHRPPASRSCDKVTSQLILEGNSECFLVCQKCGNFRFDFVGKKSDLIRSDWNVWDLWMRGSHSLVGSTKNQFITLFTMRRFQTPFQLDGEWAKWKETIRAFYLGWPGWIGNVLPFFFRLSRRSLVCRADAPSIIPGETD